jgi:hypothetical protein
MLPIFLITLPGTVQARQHYYFNKIAISRQDFTRDRTTCLQLAGAIDLPAVDVALIDNPNLTIGQNAAAAAIAGLFIGMIESARARRMSLSVERTCMADKGYGRYVVDRPVIAMINKLKDEHARLDRLFELAAMAKPLGVKGTE